MAQLHVKESITPSMHRSFAPQGSGEQLSNYIDLTISPSVAVGAKFIHTLAIATAYLFPIILLSHIVPVNPGIHGGSQ